MVDMDDFKINLNQNLWGLIVNFLALGASEYYKLCALLWLSCITSVVVALSLICTTGVYTYVYWKRKMKRLKS